MLDLLGEHVADDQLFAIDGQLGLAARGDLHGDQDEGLVGQRLPGKLDDNVAIAGVLIDRWYLMRRGRYFKSSPRHNVNHLLHILMSYMKEVL